MMDNLIVFGANKAPDKLRFHLDPELIVWMETTFFQGQHCCSEVVANEQVKKRLFLMVQNLKHRQIMVMLYCACAYSARDTPDQ